MKTKTIYLIFSLSCIHARAADSRALLIGINNYHHPKAIGPTPVRNRIVLNLFGCKNDVAAFNSVLISRFQFRKENISQLTDENAVKNNILQGIQKLLDLSKPKDIAFVFYSGHGSTIYNEFSKEHDKMDETIVPADALKPGVADIRDKELGILFQKFVQKGVILTVIFDCCHSGSLTRGPGKRSTVIRQCEGTKQNVKDDIQLKEMEYLYISAARENEKAEEEQTDNDSILGVFTNSFISAIGKLPVNSSSILLFTNARAIIKSNAKVQEPTIEGAEARQKSSLFGNFVGEADNKTRVAVISTKDDLVILQGGFAIGIQKGSELQYKLNKNDLIVLQVDQVIGINQCIAKVKSGAIAGIKPGINFEVTNWVASEAALLKVYLDSNSFSPEQIHKIAEINLKLSKLENITWIHDVKECENALNIYSEGGVFYVNSNKGNEILGEYSYENINRLYTGYSKIYAELPADKKLYYAIRQRFKNNRFVVFTRKPDEAHYILCGNIDKSGKLVYGLRKAQIRASDTIESMPLQTSWITLNDHSENSYQLVANEIYKKTLSLSKIRGWLLLLPPVQSEAMPFRLTITNAITHNPLDSSIYHVGDSVSLHLVIRDGLKAREIKQKYIYVFGIDQSGRMFLFFPNRNTKPEENLFPVQLANNQWTLDKTIYDFRVGMPTGTDNYFILACDEPIPNPTQIFMQPGVGDVSVRARGTNMNPQLINLLNMGNEGFSGHRGDPLPLQNTWYFIHFSVKCMY